jgi:hypothetical protein
MIYYSATATGFYLEKMKDDYLAANSWPDDAVEISEALYKSLIKGLDAGFIVASDDKGMPYLAARPEPDKTTLIAEAQEQRQMLEERAMQSISVVQFKQLNGRALTDDETARVGKVLDYLDELHGLALDAAPDIDWPEVPNNVA